MRKAKSFTIEKPFEFPPWARKRIKAIVQAASERSIKELVLEIGLVETEELFKPIITYLTNIKKGRISTEHETSDEMAGQGSGGNGPPAGITDSDLEPYLTREERVTELSSLTDERSGPGTEDEAASELPDFQGVVPLERGKLEPVE